MASRCRHQLCMPLLALGLTLPAFALETTPNRPPPNVIYDAGGVPIEQYLRYIVEDKRRSSARMSPPQTSISPRPISAFPVITTKAKAGLLGQPMRGKLQGGPGVPICVIGDDQLSRHWLSLNLATLEKMQARCLVVSVRDAAAFRRLKESAGTLLLTPGSFDALANAAGITVWPVLISPEGMVSQ